VRAIAVHLERLCKSFDGEIDGKERIAAINKAFRFLTGYMTFESAYRNEKEVRWMTSMGMGEDPRKKFAVSVDTAALEDSELDALGGDDASDDF